MFANFLYLKKSSSCGSISIFYNGYGMEMLCLNLKFKWMVAMQCNAMNDNDNDNNKRGCNISAF